MKEQILLDMLKKADREHPLTREEIARTFLVSDRHAREMVEKLRNEGHRVCGINSVNGYWMAKTQEDYLQFRNEYASKAISIINTIKKMDAQTCEGQVTIDDLLS